MEGQRFDLDGLTARLRALAGVEQAAVAVRDDPVLHRCLVVGVQPQAGATASPAEWDTAVHALLPGLASLRIVVGPLPRRADGRVDTAALASRRRVAAADVVSATPTQQVLIDVWQELLGLSDVGLQDNFFELGGSSLTAMQAAEKLAARLQGRRVSPRRYVFETLAQLAAGYDDVGSAAATMPSDAPAANEPADAGLMGRLKRLVRRA